MFQRINLFKFIIYTFVNLGVTANAALVFASTYTEDNRHVSLTIFLLVIIVLVVLPTFYIGKTDWLKK